MLSDIVIDGDKVEISAIVRAMAEEENKPKVYTTRVNTILTDDKLEILMPMEKTKLILLPVDGEYNLCFNTAKGLYQCSARIYDRYKSSNIYVLAFELTSNLRRFQRREYYRFNCVIDMRMRELKKDEADSVDKGHPMIVQGLPLRRALICDLSGGGMRLITDTLFEVDTYVYCSFNLYINGHLKEYEMIGRVLRGKAIDNRPGEFEQSIQFIGIDIDVREEIIRYIFEEERKIMRKNKNGF